jgi:ABC-type antimicrobial peptide transport system permease subunit
VGATFRYPFAAKKICRIVGLVGNTKYVHLQEKPSPILFFPTSQVFFGSNYTRYLVRSTLPLAQLTAAVRESVAAVSPAIGIEFLPLEAELKGSVVRERLLAALGGGFGLLAGLLAAVGLYGMLSYSVENRRNEIGIRMALGANRGSVVRLVTREAGWLLAVGVAAGIAIAMVTGRAAAKLLYGLKPGDPVTLLAAVLTLAGIGLAAAYVPARRAAALDPLAALRRE